MVIKKQKSPDSRNGIPSKVGKFFEIQCPQWGYHTASVISSVIGRFGPEADSVTKGGKRKFAAGAKLTNDFPKPAIRWGNPKTGHPRSAVRAKLPLN